MPKDERPLPGRIPLDRLPDDLRQEWIDWLKKRLARKAARTPNEAAGFARAMTRAVQGRAYHGPREVAELDRARKRKI